MTGSATAPAVSMWSPFRYRNYAVIWTATLVSNIGGWMYSSSSAWLMTSLDPSPLMVSLVQVAASLPMFLFAIPAGALADIVDRRRFLIGAESYITIVCTLFALMVWLHLITPATLLLFTFLVEAGSAATSPAWQSVVPDLVPHEDLGPALAMNSVGVNISRALGPALGGIISASFGIAAPFWINAVSNVGSIGALVGWRAPPPRSSQLPAERLTGAIRTGIRHARFNSHLRAALIRAVGFFLFASCYWALLPLLARNQLHGGSTLYGILLGAIGLSAILGAFAMPWLKHHLGTNKVVAAGSLTTAIAMLLFGVAHNAPTALVACFLAGSSWIAVVANLNVSAQLALPAWVKGRGIAIYVTVFYGAMTLGSVLWGQVASSAGLPIAHFSAAAGAVLAIIVTRRWHLQTGTGPDLTPSMSWPTPVVNETIDGDSGPVLVMVEYTINPKDREVFLDAAALLSHERGRDGAFAWGIFEDVASPGRMVETFYVESWFEHLRQHERVTKADQVIEKKIHALLTAATTTTHLLSAQRR
jgi:predicted MFS family arabinose efflux permease